MEMLAEIFGEGGLIALIIIVVLLFGGAAIPKLARNLGSAKNEFEKGLKESDSTAAATDAPAKATDESKSTS
jgi:sec-independent protein translocase protein TatA